MGLDESFYLTDMDEPQLHAFNVLFHKLYGEKDMDLKDTRRLLSGIRTSLGPHKATRSQIRAWLRKWHKAGLIAELHGKVRLGNLGLCLSVLDEDNLSGVEVEVVQQADGSMGLIYLANGRLVEATAYNTKALELYRQKARDSLYQ